MVERFLTIVLLVPLLSSCSLQVLENQREEVLSNREVEREVRLSTSDDSVALGKIFWLKSEKNVIARKSFFDPESVSGASRKIDSACRELLYKAIDALRTKDYTKAESNIERAIRIQPNDPYLWTQLAYVALKKGDELQASVFSRKAAAMAGGNELLIKETTKFLRRLNLEVN